MRDGLDDGPPMTAYAINLWRKPALIAEWKAGATLRDLATKYGVSHETARKWTELLSRKEGASRRPKRSQTTGR
jgi:transposase-like protein